MSISEKEKMVVRVVLEMLDQYYLLDDHKDLYCKKVHSLLKAMQCKDLISQAETLRMNAYIKTQTTFYKSKQ